MSQVLPVGDRGQRFEVRYRKIADAIGMHRVLGWSEKIKGAREMRDAWRKAPDVETVWIADRQRRAN